MERPRELKHLFKIQNYYYFYFRNNLEVMVVTCGAHIYWTKCMQLMSVTTRYYALKWAQEAKGGFCCLAKNLVAYPKTIGGIRAANDSIPIQILTNLN